MRVSARRLTWIAALFSCASCAALAVAACSSAYGSAGQADASDAVPPPPSVTQGDDASLADPCVHADPPAAPAVDDAPGDELPAFFMAVQSISLAASGGSGPSGFDLDGICSCDPRAGTAFDGGAACRPPGVVAACDPDGGVDNAASALATQLTPFFSLDSIAQHVISTGRRTLLVQVGKYNGQLNDPEVAIGLALSDGVRTQGCPGSVENASLGIWSPGWCGDDAWSLLASAVIPNTSQPYVQTLGYVANGVLVFRTPSAVSLPFSAAESLAVSATMFAGTLAPLGEDLQPRPRDRAPTEREKRLWTLTAATYAGRVAAPALLEALGTISIPHDGGPNTYLCDEPLFPTLRTSVCAARDVPANSDHDHDLGATCDALSLAMRVTAFPAVTGEVRNAAPQTTACTPGPGGELDGGMPYVCSP